jgi:hypothetical protein
VEPAHAHLGARTVAVSLLMHCRQYALHLQVSTMIAGRSTLRSPLYSQVERGPASGPTRRSGLPKRSSAPISPSASAATFSALKSAPYWSMRQILAYLSEIFDAGVIDRWRFLHRGLNPQSVPAGGHPGNLKPAYPSAPVSPTARCAASQTQERGSLWGSKIKRSRSGAISRHRGTGTDTA